MDIMTELHAIHNEKQKVLGVIRSSHGSVVLDRWTKFQLHVSSSTCAYDKHFNQSGDMVRISSISWNSNIGGFDITVSTLGSLISSGTRRTIPIKALEESGKLALCDLIRSFYLGEF